MTHPELTARARELFKGRTDGKQPKVQTIPASGAVLLRVTVFLGDNDSEAASALESLHALIDNWQFERDAMRATLK